MIQLSGDGERPVEAQVTVVGIGERQLLTIRHATKVSGKVRAGRQSEIKGAPEFGIDLDELKFIVARVVAKLDHGHAVPMQSVQHFSAAGCELGVIKTLRTGAHAAASGIFAYAPVHEDTLANAVLVGGKKAAAVSGDELLQQWRLSVAGQPSKKRCAQAF